MGKIICQLVFQMNKKGTARDIIFFAIVIFTFGIGFFVVDYMINTSVDKLLENEQINGTAGTVTALEGMKTTALRMDYVVFGLFIALILGMIITAWFVGGHPIFMFIYFLVVVIGVVISTVLANTWEHITQNITVFGTTIQNFTITNNIIINLPIYVGILGFIGLIVMFTSSSMKGEQ